MPPTDTSHRVPQSPTDSASRLRLPSCAPAGAVVSSVLIEARLVGRPEQLSVPQSRADKARSFARGGEPELTRSPTDAGMTRMSKSSTRWSASALCTRLAAHALVRRPQLVLVLVLSRPLEQPAQARRGLAAGNSTGTARLASLLCPALACGGLLWPSHSLGAAGLCFGCTVQGASVAWPTLSTSASSMFRRGGSGRPYAAWPSDPSPTEIPAGSRPSG